MDITTKICKEIRDLRKIHMRLFELGECINRHFSPLVCKFLMMVILIQQTKSGSFYLNELR